MNYTDRMKTQNIKDGVRERIMPIVDRLKKLPEVEGIVILGGLADTSYRNFLDKFSDADISVFISEDSCSKKNKLSSFNKSKGINLPDWLPNYEFRVPINIPGYEGKSIEINVYQSLIEKELKPETKWPESKREAYAYSSEVVFDRKGRIGPLISEKSKLEPEYRKDKLAHLLGRVEWMVNKNPERSIERGLYSNAHDMLNMGCEHLIDSLFLYNNKYTPHAKWRFEMSKDLPWKPKNYDKLMLEALIGKDFSPEDINRRRSILLEMGSEIEANCMKINLFDGLTAYDYENRHWETDRQLLSETFSDKTEKILRQKGFTLPEADLARGFMNENFVGSLKDLKNIEASNINSGYQNIYSKMINILEAEETMTKDTVAKPSPSEYLDAISSGNKTKTEKLLNSGMSANVYNGYPLKLACESGKKEIVELLLDKGAKLDLQNSNPLIVATKKGFKEIAQLLLLRGAKPNREFYLNANKKGWTDLVNQAKNIEIKVAREKLLGSWKVNSKGLERSAI